MENLLSPEQLRAFFIYAVPGIVFLYVRVQFTHGRLPPLKDAFVTYMALSVVYHAVVMPIFPKLYEAKALYEWSLVLWLSIILVVPALFGLLSGLSIKEKWLHRLMRKFNLSTVHPVECAWDWRFQTLQESWVLIVLKDNTKWAGVLGTGSFLSSDPTERDVFMEDVYELDAQNVWQKRNSSVLISHGEIQSIEFWPKGDS